MLSGIITAMITPFDKDGEVKTESLSDLVEIQVEGGVNGLFLCGTAGSGALMRRDQRKAVFKEVSDSNYGELKLLAHVGAPSTEETVDLARFAEDVGCHAVGAVPPYFVKPDVDSLMDHFRVLAGSVDIPVYVYNMPRIVLNEVSPEMMLKLMDIQNIRGVKDSSRDFINVLKYLQMLPESFEVICGTDSYIYPAVHMGARGAITGYANAFPEIYSRFWDTIKKGDHEEAKRMQFEINTLRAALQSPPLAPHYEALRLRGVEVGVPRAPLRGMTEEEKLLFESRLQDLGLL
jgi:4-hydroxy-tetrahydrodipicolinate synthase